MERKEIKFTPKWEGPIEGWATKYANKSVWRVRPEHDFDDLMQDAYIYFLTVKERYPRVVDPPHFMRLFQTCFINHINDLASRRTRRVDVAATSCSAPDADILELAVAKYGNLDEVELELLIQDAPAEIQELIRTVQNGDRKPPLRRKKNGLRETTRDYLQRMVPPAMAGLDVLAILAAWSEGKSTLRLRMKESM